MEHYKTLKTMISSRPNLRELRLLKGSEWLQDKNDDDDEFFNKSDFESCRRPRLKIYVENGEIEVENKNIFEHSINLN